MKLVQAVMGGLMILLGIALGVFVGGYLCLYGGIIQIIHEIQADPINIGKTILGAVRVLVAPPAGCYAALILIIPGVLLLFMEKIKKIEKIRFGKSKLNCFCKGRSALFSF